jgi:iron complex outermembrane recepter protein
MLPKAQSMGTITSTNPYFRPIAGETSRTVRYSYGPVLGAEKQSYPRLRAWNITLSLDYDIGGNWQAKLTGNFGRSYIRTIEPIVNAVAEQDALVATAIDTALNPPMTSPAPIGRCSIRSSIGRTMPT